MDEGVTVHHLNEDMPPSRQSSGWLPRRRRPRPRNAIPGSIEHGLRDPHPGPRRPRSLSREGWATAISTVLKRAGLSPRAFADLGRERPGDLQEPLCMTVLALRLAAHVNGVAKLHGEVSREMWHGAYPEAGTVGEVPIGSITNGIHPGTWMDPAAEAFWRRKIRLRPEVAGPVETAWAKATSVDPAMPGIFAIACVPDWSLHSRAIRPTGGGTRSRPAEVLEAGPVLYEDA